MQKLENLAMFEKKIGGISFKMRRRSTALMMEIGNVRKVLGLVAGSNAKKGEGGAVEAAEEYAELLKKFCRVALVEIDGQQVADMGLSYEEMQHVADPLFAAFLTSGLDLDPMPDSLKGPQESH